MELKAHANKEAAAVHIQAAPPSQPKEDSCCSHSDSAITEEPFKMGHVYPAQLELANIMKVIHMTAKAKNSTIEYDHAGGFIKGQELQETSYWAAGVTGIEAATEIMRYSITRRDLLRSRVVKEITDDKRPAPAVEEEEEDKKLATTTCGTSIHPSREE